MGELLSPVEAILQNILGADNILVPPGSQVEEILQAIYYNTEYENNPESRVAEILLAIKNKGVYDGPVLSRVEDILVHKLNNIPYIKHKKENLSRVEQLLLDWLEQGGGEEIIEYTGTFPMTILANGEPLLDYLISGNTVQSGTPTPDSPIMPESTGERTGNLFDEIYPDLEQGPAVKYKPIFVGNGDFTLSADYPLVQAGTADLFLLSGNVSSGASTAANGVYFGQSKTVHSVGGYVTIGYRKYSATHPLLSDYRTMLNSGSTALPYEPYGYKIPISSANTTTPVYLGAVETTRKIKKLVLTGEENIIYSSVYTRFSIPIPDFETMGVRITPFVMSHYIVIDDGRPLSDVPNNAAYSGAASDNHIIFVKTSSYTSSDDFKAFLAQQYAAGTPVTVWYVLAEPETAVVNEPLMRIGDYADTLSYAQAGVDVPTNKKPTETVIDVPTSVKPSEGYIKYTEPTDGPAPKTQVLGTKDHEIYVTSNNEVYILRR